MTMRRAVAPTILAAVLLTVILAAAVFAVTGNDGTDALPAGVHVDRILVEKRAHRLTLISEGQPLRHYDVALGRGGLLPKQQEGDNRVPEGTYIVDRRNSRSSFHLALHISYPSATDRALAAQHNVAPGGDIMIHGLRNGFGWLGRHHRLIDWTAGCVALTDAEIEEVWRVVRDGTPIEIRP